MHVVLLGKYLSYIVLLEMQSPEMNLRRGHSEEDHQHGRDHRGLHCLLKAFAKSEYNMSTGKYVRSSGNEAPM
jgi:hypothetical protein